MVFNRKNYDTKQRFGLRKLSVGTCSVLLATLFLGVSVEQTPKVHADVIDENTKTNVGNSSGLLQSSAPLRSDSSATMDESATSYPDSALSQVASASQVTARTTTSPAVTSAAQPASTTSQVAEATRTPKPATAATSPAVALTPASQAQSATAKHEAAVLTPMQQGTGVIRDVPFTPTERTSPAIASAIPKLTAMHRILAATPNATNESQADQIKANPAVTIPSADGRYTLYLTRNSWGNTANGDQPISVLLSGNVQAGDKVTVSIPNYGIVVANTEQINPVYGSSSSRSVGNNTVVTFNFIASSVINAIITIPADNGYGAKGTPMAITTPTEEPITWTVNGVDQQSTDLLIDINPVWNPSGLKRTTPNPNSTNPNDLKKLIPNFTTIYSFAVNESNGVAPGQDGGNIPWGSSQVNSAVNYGTVITIPMPTGFVLNEAETRQLNKFSDSTTIVQSGENIIITVPKGSGRQGWNSSSPYQIVGSYDIQMPATATTLTAAAPITIVQNLNADGSIQKKWHSAAPVSEEFYGADDQIPLGSMPLYGGTAYNDQNILNNGQKQIVSYFGITNQAIAPFTNYNSSFTFNFDEGLGVTDIKTPTMAGTNDYKYTITYADGSTSEGQVGAGQSISGTNAIVKIVISPDVFNQDQGTVTQMPNNNFANQTQATINAFEAYGTVAPTVASKTKLSSSMTFTGAITNGGVTQYLSNRIKLSQTVYSPADLTSSTGVFGYQSNTGTGQTNAGYLSSYSGGGLTNNIYEPIFYYVLPEWFSVDGFSTDYTKLFGFTPNTNNGVTGKPKLSLFTVPTAEPGLSRQVVKIDYSGTGYNFLAGQGANNQIHLNTLADGTNGTYQGMVYVISPTTKLTNPAYQATDTSNFAPNGITFNPAWVQGNTTNLYYAGSASFSIKQIGGANTASVAQGNQNEVFVDSSTSSVYGSDVMQYAVRLINESGDNLSNVVALINLPQASDNNGTSFTFQLTKRPTYDGDKTGYTFLYSTELGNLMSNNDPDGTKPDETGYIPADQVTDWTKIKSIIVKTKTMSNNGRSERLIFTGIDPNLAQDAGKVGYLNTGFYSDTTKPFVSSKAVYDANTTPNKVVPGNITIFGESMINFQIHYTDENGQKQTINLPELQTTYNDDGSATMMTAKEAINKALANSTVVKKIPDNYEIQSATLQTGPKTWQTNAPGGTAEFGATVQYFYNGSTVILEAVPIQRTITYTVIDQNNPASPVPLTPSTDLLVNGKAVTGNQGTAVPTDAETAFNTIKSNLESQGYVISAKSSTVPATFGPNNTALTIYVTHGTTDVSTSSEWPSTVSSSDRVALSKDITRTITVTGLPTTVDGATQTVNYTRTAVVDKVTHKVIGYVNPSDTSQTITDGDQAWTSTDDTWAAFTPSNVPAGYSISSITDANGNYANVTSENGQLTGVAAVTVPASDSNVNVTITYKGDAVSNTITFVDADNNNKQVGPTQTINGNVGETQTLNLTIPAGYELQSGATLPTSYTFGATNTPIVIPLVHKTTQVGPNGTWPSTSTDADKVPLTETVSRTINVTGLPSTVAPTVQNVEFTRTAIVDEVTGKVVGYVDPSDSTKTITNGDDAWVAPTDSSWAEWTNSNVSEGYYISSATLADGTNYSDITKQNDIITGLSSVNVTPTTSDTVVNVNYAKVDLDLTINHDTITNTYNGSSQPVAPDVISAITHTVESSNTNVPVTNIAQAIKDANLTSDDYSYTDSEGNVLSGAPTDAGNYHIILNNSGLGKINQVAGGLTVNYDPTKSYVNYVIAPAAATATLSGDNSKTYDGQAVTTAEVTKDGKIAISAKVPGATKPAYVLQDGDYNWYSGDDSAELTTVPVNVGQYTIKLSTQGITNIKNYYGNSSNIIWSDDAITGSASYEITPASASYQLSGKTEVTYTGNPASMPLEELKKAISSPNTVSGQGLVIPNLIASDFIWSTQDTSAPTNAGTYTIALNEAGQNKVKDANPNYALTLGTNSFTYTIKAADASAKLAGENSKTYNGQAVTTAEVNSNGQIKVTIDYLGKSKIYTLQDGDYTWNTQDTSSPTNVGQYTITLTDTGLSHLQEAINQANGQGNVILIGSATSDGSASYTITPAPIVISGKGSQTNTYTGTTPVIDPSNFPLTLTPESGAPTPTIPSGTLISSDFVIKNANGETITPTDKGGYTVYLTSGGIEKLNKLYPNYTWPSADQSVGSLTINAATTTATVAGANSKVYNGQPLSTSDLYTDVSTISVKIKGIVPNVEIPYTLQTGDYSWNTPNGEAPTNAGSYTLTLTSAGVSHLQDTLNERYGAGNVTISANEVTGNASFAIEKATATVNFTGKSQSPVEYTGQTGKFNASDYPVSISTNNGLKLNIPSGVNLSVANGDFVFTDANGNSQTTEPTKLGSYTVSLSQSGFEKLQSQTDNYNWINSTKGTYSITKAENVSVTLSGSQVKTYTAKEFTNGSLDLNDYKVSLGNGLTYQLVAGDLEFALNQDPTNVGTYQVQLSAQGQANIAKLQADNYGYNFDNVGTGSFNIVKATPSASFTGQASKTFDGTPISNYAPSITITAPGENNVTLTAGVDYVWSKDGQNYQTAPADAGNYTVTLTQEGINKVKAVNAANLDWTNVTISQNATYDINKATAMVNFGTPASQTVEYGQGSFNAGDFSPAISTNNQVTVNVPAGVGLSVAAGDYVFTDAQGNSQTTVPTELGTYTVTLSESGFAKLQSQTGNYNWENKASGSYTVNKATNIPVALTNLGNGQKVTYTGNQFTNSAIDPSDYQVTLGNGETYQLVAGDLEFVPGQNPTNVGTYQVQLSAQGKEHIAAVDPTHYSYDFNKAGVGSFEIAKATPTVEFTAKAAKTFDGTPIALDQYSTQPTVKITAPGKATITLTAGDYDWVDQAGKVYTTAPSNVGTYMIQLTVQGKNKILQNTTNAANLDWANAQISGEGSYTITQARATAILSGSASKTYDGQAVTTSEINGNGDIEVTVKIPNSGETVTYKLTAGDYTWKTPSGKVPIDAGTYTLTLSPAGLDNLQSAIDAKFGQGNVAISSSDLRGSATFMINKDPIIIAGNGSQTHLYTGTTPIIDPSNFPITLTPEGNAPIPTIPSGTLTSGDFVIKDNDGHTVTPTEVGDYKVYLTPEGIEKLQKLYPNYEWPTTDQEVGSLTIVPANMNVIMSGQGAKVSDGQPVNIALATLIDSLAGEKLNKAGLTIDDFSWNTPDGSAPSRVGNYEITLNEKGISKLQADNPNYKIHVSGSFKYTITAAHQQVEYVDENGKPVKTINNIASAMTNYGELVAFNAASNLPTNYELIDSSQAEMDIKVENGVTRIKVKAATETITETKTVTRTIIITQPDGKKMVVPQTVTFTRTVTTDKVTAEKTYGEWDKASGTWESYTPVAIPGYSIPEIPAETVTPDTLDKTVELSYTKKPLVETTETKTVTRTIIITQPDGKKMVVPQTVTFTRTKYTDEATGEVTYGEWDKASGTWESYTPVAIPGYSIPEIPAETVTPDTLDKTIELSYTKTSVEQEKPTNPAESAKPDKPTSIPGSSKQNNTGYQENGTVGNTTIAKISPSVTDQAASTSQKQAKLPQTGNRNNALMVTSGLVVAMLSLLGLVGRRKKEGKEK